MVTLENNDYTTAFADSRIGGRDENQDSFGAANTPLGYLMTVCDGMGGGPGGLTASTIAVDEIIKGVKEADPENTPANNLIRAVRRANKAIIDRAQEEPDLQGMGSTCTAVIITSQNAVIAHVGDSRVYQFRGNKKIFRTFDHSMVFELVKNKVLTEEQARLAQQSNVITRALGITDDVDVEIDIVPYKQGDRFLLCSDGIHGSMPEKELIKRATDKSIALGKLVDQIATNVDEIGRSKSAHHDNLTLIMADTLIDSIDRVPIANRTKHIIYIICLLIAIGLLFGIVKMFKSCGNEVIPSAVIIDNDSIAAAGDTSSVAASDTANVQLNDTLPPTQDNADVTNNSNQTTNK